MDTQGKLTENFTWNEALYLKQWDVHVAPPEVVYNHMLRFSKKVQMVRDFLRNPMHVTSWYRPEVYNSLVKGAKHSWHRRGGALDFYCKDIKADKVRELLLPRLADIGIRMEDLPGSNWVHIDDKEPINKRYFKP